MHVRNIRTESIDKQVVPMILPQDLHLARVLADGKTVEEEEDSRALPAAEEHGRRCRAAGFTYGHPAGDAQERGPSADYVVH